MHRVINFILGALVMCLTVVSCSLRNEVTVVDKNFGEEIETVQNLVFRFNKDLAPDSVLNLWDSTAYIEFSPAIKGAFKWNSAKELVFSPSGEFKPATAYIARLNKNILRFEGTGLKLEEESNLFKFHTPYLKTTNSMAWWSLAPEDPSMVQLNVSFNFNYHIDPTIISNFISISLNGKPTDFKISDSGISQTLTMKSTSLPKDLIDGCKLNFTINKGAKCQSCEEGTPEIITGEQDIKAPDKLEVTHVEGVLETGGGSILVYCNQEVILKEVSKFIKISPSINFTIESNGNGFIINGDFQAGNSYQLDVNKSLTGAFGGAMDKDYTSLVPFGEMEPSIGFASRKGIYMSTNSSRKVAINIVNMPKVNVRILKIYENNIIAFMRYHRYNDYWDEEGTEVMNYNDYNIENIGDVILEQEYETKNLTKQNGVSLLNLDFTEQNQYRGIYLVSVSSTEDRWRKASKLISISDVGLIARQANDEIYVFANSIKDATPIKGAKVTLISTNNQVLTTSITDGQGVAVIKSIDKKYPGFKMGMITVRSGDDFNYMSLADSRIEDSRFDVGGKTDNPAGYEAFVYGEREIFRPGEKVNLNVIVRTSSMENLALVPVKIKVLMPNGREYMSLRKILNSQGAAESNFQLNNSVVTGTWSVDVFSANDVLLASKNISVEEFIPDRISVTVTKELSHYNIGDSVKCETVAMNLFGTPATQRNYEMDFSLRKKTLFSKKFSNYNFNISGADNISFSSILRQGKTDNDGKSVEYFKLNEGYRNTGLLQGRIYITVFDETGRPVNRINEFDVNTQPVYYGVLLSEYYNNARQPMQIALAAIDSKGNPSAASAAQVQVIRVFWETVMERSYGSSYRYVSQREERVLVNKTMNISKDGSALSFTPQESGQYYVRIQDPGSNTYVQSEFYAYGWGYTQNNSFEVNNEGTVDMEFDKEIYATGDKAKILFKTPFAGKLLVTVERNKVFEHFYIQTDKRSASIEIPVKEEYLPNVYITATLFRPLDEGIIPVTIAHGFAPLLVEKKSNKLPVEIIVAEKSRSNTKQQIKVKTSPRSDIEVTVAVVDEGIMQLKNSITPDAHAYFYQKRALEVNAFDIYPYVLPDIKLRKSSTGGDGYDLQKRVNPLTNKRVKLVSYWSGILKTDGNGVATCSVDIPQFSGDLRVMAIAYKDKSFGSDEKHIKVADPIVISPSMPRFLSPGDTLILPVTVTNTTNKTQNVTIQLDHTGPLSVINSIQQNISIAANQESRQVFQVAVKKQIGEGSITVKVNNGSESFTDKTEITVRPAASLQKISGAGEIGAGSTTNLSMTNNFIEGSRNAKLLISRSPVVQFSDQLSYLLGYPHGCIEQTISTAFPQLYYSNLVKSLSNKPGFTVQISTNIQAAIRKLQSMQQYNGSMSYWPGGNEESWWGSAYAYHFLNESKKAGYDVPSETISKLNSYLMLKVKQHPKEDYYYYDLNNKEVRKEIPSKDIFYSLYLMALYSKADIATMNFYRSKNDELAMDSKYLLAASYLATGDRNTYAQLLPSVFDGEKSKKSTGGNFYSYIRDEALALNALLETDPSNSQIGPMVRHLSQQMKSEKYLSTQERAFSFLALGKFMKSAGETKATAIVTANGKTVGEFKGDDLTINKGLLSGSIKISTSGTGKLFYFWEMEGLSADGSFTQEDSYLIARKTFFNRFGQPLPNLNTIKQNDLIVVKLSLSNTQRNKVENIVISDILPAGFEIENPRISAVPELSWIKDNAQPDYMDIRDDRIHFFTPIEDKPLYFYYLVRAVSTGKFNMGPVSADAMYDGSYHSYHGAGVVKIE